MEDGSPPGVSLNSHQEAKELIFGDDSCKYQLQDFLKSDRKEMTILPCGKTGVGKSHLNNALIGEKSHERGSYSVYRDNRSKQIHDYLTQNFCS